MIGGQPYVLLDMGREGRLPFVKRSGVEGLYGRSIPLDIRYLTSYVRDISVVTARHYRGLAAPARVRRFPADLRDPSLEYSGIYEDGWVAERSFVTLRAGDAGRLVIRADVLRRAQPSLQVLVDGRTVLSKRVAAGSLEVNVPVSASRTRRRVELVWDGATRLSAPDLRPVAALLEFVGIVPASSR